jgi:hypothetical protein
MPAGKTVERPNDSKCTKEPVNPYYNLTKFLLMPDVQAISILGKLKR